MPKLMTWLGLALLLIGTAVASAKPPTPTHLPQFKPCPNLDLSEACGDAN